LLKNGKKLHKPFLCNSLAKRRATIAQICPFYAIVVRKNEQQLHIQFFGYHPAQLKTPPEDRSEGAFDQY